VFVTNVIHLKADPGILAHCAHLAAGQRMNEDGAIVEDVADGHNIRPAVDDASKTPDVPIANQGSGVVTVEWPYHNTLLTTHALAQTGRLRGLCGPALSDNLDRTLRLRSDRLRD